MGDFNLIKFEGQPLEKLFDVISKAIGKIYTPRGIRKEADARAYEIEVIERAKAKASANKQDIEQDMFDRIQERIIYREVKKQDNIDAVTKIAVEQLQDVKNISTDPVDEDWTVRFFNIVEDVSDEQMQQLWGKILAGEVKAPSSFSIHTIEFLKNMTKSEAELFTKVANYVISLNNSPFIFRGDTDETLNNNSFSFDERLFLIDLGLIQSETNIVKKFLPHSNDLDYAFLSGKYIIKATKKANSPLIEVPILRLTRIGEELMKLLTTTAIDNYIKDFSLYLQNKGFNIEYAFVLRFNANDTITHTQPWMKF
jgi:uncharacterized repeat protein (TIGR03899 family)